MKILVFTSLFPNNIFPNAGVFIKERMAGVAKIDGCQMKVVAPVPYFPSIGLGWRWAYSQVVQREQIDGLEVFHPRYFMIPKIGMTAYGWMMFLSVIIAVKAIQREFDFDLIDAHWVYPDGFAAVLLGSLFNKPVIVSARGTDINGFAEFPLIRKLLRYTLNKADRVIAVSEALKQAIVRLGISATKISVVPNGVDANKFFPIAKESAREKLGLPKHKKVIISIGRLVPEKGLDLLLHAVKILVEHFHEKEILLVIVGDGALRKKINSLVCELGLSGYVRLEGSIPHSELRIWYSAADISCLASQREGWPNVILESMACGIPVLATAVGGVPEVINSSSIGLLMERDTCKMAEKISQAINQNWQTETILKYARQRTWEKTAQSVVRVFEAALHGPKIPPDDDVVKL